MPSAFQPCYHQTQFLPTISNTINTIPPRDVISHSCLCTNQLLCSSFNFNALTKIVTRPTIIAQPKFIKQSTSIKCNIDSNSDMLISQSTLDTIISDTRLENQPLTQVYSSKLHGFDNQSFFEKLLPLDGVPSLLLGSTADGVIFGGYTAFGFAARDDYREATNNRALFVFKIDSSGKVIEAARTDRVQYDFYDYAVRFGAALLTIPMNPSKHIMRANVGTSNCVLPDGSTSVFGEYAMATLDHVQVYVEKKYVDMLTENAQPQNNFFSRLFGG